MPRISQLPSLTAADNADEIAIVDVSASTTKKITRGDLLKSPLPTNSVTTAAVTNGSITAPKLDSASFGTVDANGWADYGTYFLKSITITNTVDVAAQANSPSINLSSNFGVPVNSVVPTLENTTLNDVMVSDASWSAMCVMVRTASTFNVAYANARNGVSKVGTRRITAVVYGRKP